MPQVVHWNPRRRLARSGPLWRVPKSTKREGNFGDLLGPIVVRRICEKRDLRIDVSPYTRLLAIGSIINVLGRAGDVIWGAGIHGNHLPSRRTFLYSTFARSGVA